MSSICIIPARGGSKRIPRKNIKEFCGKPVIAYSIEAAIKSNLFDEVMVSTDDEEIADVAKKYGADVPFLRSKENSNDFAGLTDVILEVVSQYEKSGKKFDNICCILPTAPFVTAEKLNEAMQKLKNEMFDCVFPVVEYSYPIQRSLKIDDDFIKMRWPENFTKRSQDLEPTYHDSGQFYLIKTESLLEEKKLFAKRSCCIVISEMEAQDIDTEKDWKLAEIKYKMMLGNN